VITAIFPPKSFMGVVLLFSEYFARHVGLVPDIHVFPSLKQEDVDGRAFAGPKGLRPPQAGQARP
jgi:hypothetical protein